MRDKFYVMGKIKYVLSSISIGPLQQCNMTVSHNGPLYFRRKGPMGIAVHLKIQCTSAPLALGDDLSTIVLAL